ncbi:MAG: tetratricopeptide repeat protein [Polyangiales bacterium]
MRFPLRLLLVFAFACGSSSDETEPATPTTEPAPEVMAEPIAEPIPELPCELGYATPFSPTRANLRSSRAALAMHRRGEFAEAASAFAALAAEAPAYGSARFNLACAQTKLGQLEEAKATLAQLFCEDLPTNLPRALGDEDLEPLRADLAALGSDMVERYRDASAGAVPILAFGQTGFGDGLPAEGDPETLLLWSQPGFWTDQRFVPAGPRQQSRRSGYESTPMFPSFIAEDRVVQVQTISSNAEGDFLPPLRVVERSLFDGVVRSDERFDESQDEYYGVFIGVHEGQTYVRFDPRHDFLPHRTLNLATRRVMPNPPMHSARIEFGMSHWRTVDVPAELTLRRGKLRVGERSIDLDSAHRRMFGKHLIADSGVALLLSSSTGDCGYPDRFLIETVDLETGATLWKESGEGQRLVRFQNGRLWVQTNDALFMCEDPRQNVCTELPAGFGLSSLFLAFNPMC